MSVRINWASKCLEAGQQCSTKAIAQYPQKGFGCIAKGSVHVLRKKA